MLLKALYVAAALCISSAVTHIEKCFWMSLSELKAPCELATLDIYIYIYIMVFGFHFLQRKMAGYKGKSINHLCKLAMHASFSCLFFPIN